MAYFKQYIVAAVVFLLLDSFWLGYLAKDMYQDRLGPVVNLEFDLQAGIFFYLIYIAGIVYFAINPAFKEGRWQHAALNGVLLGGLCYATYDLTNMATIINWPLYVVIADIIWGMVITGVSAALAFLIVKHT